MSKQVIMSFDNYLKLCEMLEEIPASKAIDFLTNNVKEHEIENCDDSDKIEAKLDYINSTITNSRISQEVKSYSIFYLQDIKTYILKSQQRERELERLKTALEKFFTLEYNPNDKPSYVQQKRALLNSVKILVVGAEDE